MRKFDLIDDILWRFNSKNKTKCFQITVKTQQQCINISILSCKQVSVL